MFCPKCGLQLQEGTNFCPRCGTLLNAQYTQPPQPSQQIPQNPVPVQQQKKKNKPFWKSCLTLILVAVAVFILLLVVIGSGGRNSGGSRPTPTLISSAETSEPAAIPTTSSTPKVKIPDYCGDAMQLELIRLATILNTDQHPYAEEFDPENNICLYSIRNTHSFLLTEVYGYITFHFTEDNYLYASIMNLDYIDSAEFREMATDWGAVLYSYMDKKTDPLTAYSAVKSAEANSVYASGFYTIGAELKRDTMKYQIGIFDLSRVQSEE